MKTALLINFLFLFIVQCMNNGGTRDTAKEKNEYEALIQANYTSFINNGWNLKDIDNMKILSSINYSWNLNGIEVAGNQSEMEAIMKVYFTGFPDGQITLGSPLVKNDRLATRWIFKGTNTGVYSEKPPTGKRVEVSGFSEILFDDSGKMIREDIYYNELELLQQLGYSLIPPDLE